MKINRHQQQVIAYLLEENRTLHAKLGGRRIRFTNAERRRLAALVFPIGRKRLKSLATLATPDTLMRWYKQLVAPHPNEVFMMQCARQLTDPFGPRDAVVTLALYMDHNVPRAITAGLRR